MAGHFELLECCDIPSLNEVLCLCVQIGLVYSQSTSRLIVSVSGKS
jgi:hypothetical protein